MGVVKVTLNNDTLIDITDTTVAANEMFKNKVATGVDGEKMTGTYEAPTPKTASDVTVSGATVTVPAGAYASQVQKSVATTTQATPSISFDDESGIITATASQTEGYVSAGTKSATETLDILNDDDIAFAGTTRTGKRVTVGIGYSTGISKQIPDGSATTPATTITANPTISVSSNGLITAVTSASEDIEPVTSEGWIYDDFGGVAGTVTVSGSATSQLTTQAAKTVTPTESEQTAVASHCYTTGEVKVGAISSTYVGSGIAQRDSDDLTANGATITAPAGYYSASASKSVASGTAGTPTASKGTVSNHSITVTPSVTNTTGYITGGTKSGTGVSVSASELVSGTLSVTENGTADVTNYASVDVNVETEPTIESLTVTPSETQQVFDGMTVGSQVASVSFTGSGTKNLSSALTAGEEYYVTTRVSTDGMTYRTVYEDVTEIPNSGGVSVGANVTLSSTSATLSSNTYDRVIVTVYEVTVLDGYLPVTVNAISSTYVGSGVTTKAATTYHPSATDQAIATGTYLTGAQTIKAVTTSNLSAENIVSGVTVKVGDADDDDCVTSVTGTAVSGGMSETDLKYFIQRDYRFTSIDWPDGITSIGSYAFAYCIYFNPSSLPSGITSIGRYAFYNCQRLALTSLPSGINSIGEFAFHNCKQLALTSLPSGVSVISQYAFNSCEALALTSLPSIVNTIASYAFQYCYNLALTSLPSGLTEITAYCFHRCYSLNFTTLPSSITMIRTCCFKECTGLTSISCDGVITTWEASAFNGSSTYPMALTSASFPNTNLPSNFPTVFGFPTAANACQLLEFADIGSVNGFASSSFANCYSLKTLVLRKTTVVPLQYPNSFSNTPMSGYDGKTGTVYVPQSLISSYQTATNWSTLYNNGTVTFEAIEGSDYELD